MGHKTENLTHVKISLQPKFQGFSCKNDQDTKIQRQGSCFLKVLKSPFGNPRIAKKALVFFIFFFSLNGHFDDEDSCSIEKTRVILKKNWRQVSSSVSGDPGLISPKVLFCISLENGLFWRIILKECLPKASFHENA